MVIILRFPFIMLTAASYCLPLIHILLIVYIVRRSFICMTMYIYLFLIWFTVILPPPYLYYFSFFPCVFKLFLFVYRLLFFILCDLHSFLVSLSFLSPFFLTGQSAIIFISLFENRVRFPSSTLSFVERADLFAFTTRTRRVLRGE